MTATTGSGELVVLPSLKARPGLTGGLVLTRKFLEGVAAYAARWPGRVTTLAAVDDAASGDMDPVEVPEGGGIERRPADPAALGRRLAEAAVVLAFLSPYEAPVTALCRASGTPLVFYAEYAPSTERQIIDAETSNPLRRWRRKLWLLRAERIRRRMLASAAGLQCSGTPVHDAYCALHPNTLLFFDNRVARREVASDGDLAARAAAVSAGAPLRLAFGGRLTAMKGVMDLPKVAAALHRVGIPFTLDVYGLGPLEAALRARIAAEGLDDRVRLRGALDFRDGWIPTLRREVDLFLCCHPQGDPSSTYPEAMSCGVPIAGYANDAFVGVLRHGGGGWSAPVGDAEGLARGVARLHADRAALIAAGRRARDFAAAHCFEDTFDRRAAHLAAASRPSGGAAPA